jgi:hypothetical protein
LGALFWFTRPNIIRPLSPIAKQASRSSLSVGVNSALEARHAFDSQSEEVLQIFALGPVERQ